MSNTLDSNQPEHDAVSDHPFKDESADEPPPVDASMEVEIIVDDFVEAFATRPMMARAVRLAAAHRGFTRGEIGIRVTDDATIRDLNRTHLGHDYETDVISFGYTARGDRVEGELVVSVDTAARLAHDDWPPAVELLLYVVHGTLHITGMDDHDAGDRAAMRQAEQAVMTALGFPSIHKFGADQLGADQEIPPTAFPGDGKERNR